MKLAITILLAATLSGCEAVAEFWGTAGCEDAQRSAISRYGQPENVDSSSGDGWSSESYWWWSKGRSETFQWGDNYDGCERSVFTFSAL